LYLIDVQIPNYYSPSSHQKTFARDINQKRKNRKIQKAYYEVFRKFLQVKNNSRRIYCALELLFADRAICYNLIAVYGG